MLKLPLITVANKSYRICATFHSDPSNSTLKKINLKPIICPLRCWLHPKCIEHKLWTKTEAKKRSRLHGRKGAEREKGKEEKQGFREMEKLHPE